MSSKHYSGHKHSCTPFTGQSEEWFAQDLIVGVPVVLDCIVEEPLVGLGAVIVRHVSVAASDSLGGGVK